ncbi:hypothetical protein [Mycobacterium sp. 94-17]|uniref:hypothetical protein n=1 Tax=Mycobacterium sp. 94-17 TaxID=2986147 RepID=UPI002D1F8BF6|nr:hypothetical protein [Mycobacterium sp. 94-17]MEB4208744.1 hypothetical protein [Mycobacterium sp. 94-17]
MPPRTREQLLEAFEEQIEFLERSNELFDQGHLSESKRLAVTLRVLFHHTAEKNPRGSHALINQLGLENTLTWVATAGRPDPRNWMPTFGLIQQGITIKDGEAEPHYRAPLDNFRPAPMRTTIVLPRGSRLYLEMWWTDPVVKDADGKLFSRKDFVLALVNKEGGAHIDPEILDSYNKIANFNSMGWTYSEGPEGRALTGPMIPVGPGAAERRSSGAASRNPTPRAQEGWTDPMPMTNPVPYMVRQISHEVVKSVHAQRDRIK